MLKCLHLYVCVRARAQSWGVVPLLPLQVLGVLLRSSDVCGESSTSRAALLVLHLNFSHLVELTLLSVSFVTQSTETHTEYVLEGSFLSEAEFDPKQDSHGML